MKSPTQIEAIGLALAAYTCWVGADTCLKAAGASTLNPPQIMGVVGIVEAVTLLLYATARRQLHRLRPRQPLRVAGRACLDLINNLCVVVAVRHLPLALFYILVFVAPLVSVVLAALWLHEPLDFRRGLAVTVGFLGVVLAVDPRHAFGHPGQLAGYFACLACVLCFAVSTVWTRELTQQNTRESILFVYGLLAMLLGAAATVHHTSPVSLRLAAQLVAIGLFSLVGSVCFYAALQHTATANVVQYHYSQLLSGALLAWLIWRERPTLFMVAGAVIIIAAGFYTASQATSPPAPIPDPTSLA